MHQKVRDALYRTPLKEERILRMDPNIPVQSVRRYFLYAYIQHLLHFQFMNSFFNQHLPDQYRTVMPCLNQKTLSSSKKFNFSSEQSITSNDLRALMKTYPPSPLTPINNAPPYFL